jgi:CDP-diacylglycerol---serine O-phosphatidyltransferase
MTVPPPDGSRDRRIEDPSNLYVIHPLGRLLIAPAIRAGVSANLVSIVGLVLGTGAALAFTQWHAWPFALLGLVLSVGWLVADGLDGMVARATGTASPLGRALDGMCDHGVFALIYCSLAWSVGTVQGWVLAICAAAAHAVQSSLYEGDRARFHRRAKGVAITAPAVPSGSFLVQLYDTVSTSLDRVGMPFERRLAAAPDPVQLGQAYAAQAVAPMRLMTLLTANIRVWTVFAACLLGSPQLFWWVELVPLTAVAVIGILWHRRVERAFGHATATEDRSPSYIVKEQGQ